MANSNYTYIKLAFLVHANLMCSRTQYGEAAATAARNQARAEAAVKPLDASTLAAQFEMERAGAKVGTELAAIGLTAFWSKEDAPGDQAYRFRLQPLDRFSMPGTPVSLRFENTAEVAALTPTPELAAVLAHNTNWGLSVTYVPVGASDDRLKGGPTVVGHIISVDTVDGSAPRRRILSVRIPTIAAIDSDRNQPPVPIEASRAFR